MKAKKVNEMIDPYASEDTDMGIDVSYRNTLIEKWCEVYLEDYKYTMDIHNSLVTINESVIIEQGNEEFIEFPMKRLKVEGSLSLYKCDIGNMPEEVITDFYLEISRSTIKKLPEKIITDGDLMLDHTNITSLPDNLKINGTLALHNNKFIKELPANLKCEDLEIQNTNITGIPYDADINDIIFISPDMKGKLKYPYKYKNAVHIDYP